MKMLGNLGDRACVYHDSVADIVQKPWHSGNLALVKTTMHGLAGEADWPAGLAEEYTVQKWTVQREP
jgi:hypothetical protein